MAIILVKAKDNNVPDSPGKWYANQPVAVVEDDHVFGSAEVPEAGNFVHLSYPGVPAADMQYVLEQHDQSLVERQSAALRGIKRLSALSNAKQDRPMVARRRYKMQPDQTFKRT